MILDVTAGNRLMWHKNRNPEGVIFIDKEIELQYPPDIQADNTRLPIRTDLNIDAIIFDPPWGINMPPWWMNKKSYKNPNKWSDDYTYFGDYKSKRELIAYIHKAQQEFKKYTKRLCFKWGERDVSLWKILPLFVRDGWKETHRVKHDRGLHTAYSNSGSSKTRTWWVVLKQ